jgi:type IV secretion system protein VirD4
MAESYDLETYRTAGPVTCNQQPLAGMRASCATRTRSSEGGIASPLPPQHAKLLLGWQRPDAERRRGKAMGFGEFAEGPARHAGSRRRVVYRGDGHLMCIAPTGAGKGRGLIIPNLLQYPGPVIVTDPKGENYQVTGRRRREMGHRVIALDPFHVATDQSDRLNPFDLFRLPGSQPDADAEMLADLLTGGAPTSMRDPFWDLASGGLLTGLIGMTLLELDSTCRNLGTVLDLLHQPGWEDKLAGALKQKELTHRLIYNELAGYLGSEPDRCRSSIKSTAQAKVKALGCDAVRKAMSDSTFDLGDLVRGAAVDLFLILPPDKLRSHRAVLRLWLGVILTALVRRPSIPAQRTLILLDEAAQLGPLDVLRQAATLLRGFGVQLWTFWQDLSQLRRLYPEDWRTIVNNARVLQAFGVANGLMATECAAVLGCKPRDLIRLGSGGQIMLTPRRPPRRLDRLDYLRDRCFQGLFAPNRRYAGPGLGR